MQALVVAGALLYGGAVGAAAPLLQMPPAYVVGRVAGSRDPTSLREAAGKVKWVDRDHNQMVVDGTDERGIPVVLDIDQFTTIFVEGRTGTLEDIAEGSQVRISYAMYSGRNRAQWIEVSLKPLPKKPHSFPAKARARMLPGSSESL